MYRKRPFALLATLIAALALDAGTIAGVSHIDERTELAGATALMRARSITVSEPASLVLFGAGLWTLAAVRRRQHRRGPAGAE